MQFTRDDRRLLDLLQTDFPLVEAPYASLAEALQTTEERVIESIRRLREDRVIRQISAIFDTRSLGYESSLVAMRVRPERLDHAVEVVNGHPGVSHNYERNHTFNLWFTLAVPPTSRLGLALTLERLHDLTGTDSVRALPTLRVYKIGLKLDMTGEMQSDAADEPAPAGHDPVRRGPPPDARVQRLVRALQKDLALVPRPFDAEAGEAGLTTPALLDATRELLASGLMRRFSTVLFHRRAGFIANAMGVWMVPEERVDECGRIMAGLRAVSHCYRRPAYADWPYPLFSMVHGRDRGECDAALRELAARTGLTEYLALYSTREFKKVRVRYFDPAFEAWEARYGGV